MKKQNANNKLAFIKAAVVELNDSKLNEVNGGTGIIVTSHFCISVAFTYLIYEAL